MQKAEQNLIQATWEYYQQYGRHELPWRQTTDPYRIAVSEVMLQQTQVIRVLPKYRAFLRQFPTTKQLAEAPLSDVLRVWQGLGYNRRAKLLQQSAITVSREYNGRWPRTYDALLHLPGVGPYTAAAIAAFAYNQPMTMVETNIRTVVLHHIFPTEQSVAETDIVAVVARTLDQAQPRQWYWALMDYGAALKQRYGNQNRRAATYRKQSPFAGSNRQIRGAVLRYLSTVDAATIGVLAVAIKQSEAVTQSVVERLAIEGLLTESNAGWQLPQ